MYTCAVITCPLYSTLSQKEKKNLFGYVLLDGKVTVFVMLGMTEGYILATKVYNESSRWQSLDMHTW